MSAPLWKCHEHVARLELDCFHATLDGARPADGLTLSGGPGGRGIYAKLLGLVLPRHRGGDIESPLECYAYGAFMVISYQEATGRPFRVDAVWRVLGGGPAEEFLAAVDLIVSVRTELLDSRPEVVVQSALPVAAMFRALGPALRSGEPLPLPPSAPLRLSPADGPGCVLWRLPGEELSYVEMISPGDFHDDEAALDAAAHGSRLRHCLFPQSLEKGVLLRARVRGAFLPRADDCSRAAACYAAFAVAEPPLDAF